jgi:NAD(P)-dependent dehydrogenase (short-subunit alcohol dehydrogenase family)
MTESLQGKIAAVTGGTRGIGRAIVERLLREGAAVALCARTQESVDRTATELGSIGRVFAMAADVTQEDQARSFFEGIDREFGRLDILVNNAGGAVFKKVADMSPEEWRLNIDLNLNGSFYCSREALSRFRRSGGGFVVNISSLAGKNPFSGGAGYNAAKAGLNLFTEAMMLDHRQENVRVCSIMPGSVDTHFSGDPGKPRSGNTSWMIAPEDVAETVALVLKMPSRTMISKVEIRPSKPQKS